ncbi:DUF3971 domain-containing protein [Bartonella sp. DGB2]|uniref:YhdP family protein n=1 Tax=Bartonella sp. DGB2 TaxID=3388426 RepID=UPI00398FE5B6
MSDKYLLNNQNQDGSDLLYSSAIEDGSGTRLGNDFKHPIPDKRRGKVFYTLTGISLLLLIMISFFFIALKRGIETPYITAQIQKILENRLTMLGQVRIERARLSLDQDYHLVLVAENMRFLQGRDSNDKIGRIQLGISIHSLFLGVLHIHKIMLSDADLNLGSKGLSVFQKLSSNSFNRPDIDAMSSESLTALDEGLAFIRRLSLDTVMLDNIHIMGAAKSNPITLRQVKLSTMAKRADLSANIVWNEQLLRVTSAASLRNDGKLADISLDVEGLPLHLGDKDSAIPYLSSGHVDDGYLRVKGLVNFHGEINRPVDKNPTSIQLRINMTKGMMDVGAAQDMPTQFLVEAYHEIGSDKAVILPSFFTVGGLKLPLSGEIALVMKANEEKQPLYDYSFDLKIKNAISAPQESPEGALVFSGRLVGKYRLSDYKIALSEINITTPSGIIFGEGNLRFGQGTPETILLLHAKELSIADAKQLWPVNIANSARRWVLPHIFGGQLRNAQLELALPLDLFHAKRAMKPLSADEMRLTADIVNTRSDLVGTLPPLSKASGRITIEGSTIALSLNQGTIYLSDDSSVNLSTGLLTIPWGDAEFIYADLTTNIKGSVGAVGALIGCKPIDSQRFLPFNSQKASGEVDLNLNLRFALNSSDAHSITQPSLVPQKPHYDVNLHFNKLSLDQKIDGMQVSNVSGYAKLSPNQVEIEGVGTLNNAMMKFTVLGFFKNGTFLTKKTIELSADDKLRAKYFPALNELIKGPTLIKANQVGDGDWNVVTDLSSATLEFPGLGWKKGANIDMSAEFNLPANFTTARTFSIKHFALTGVHTLIQGSLDIKDKHLVSADFSKANLNANDNISFQLKEQENGYYLSVQGSKYDARSLIQHLGQKTFSELRPTPFTLDASIDTLIGFGKEELQKVKAHFTTRGGSNFNAVTKGGMLTQVSVVTQESQQVINIQSNDAGAFLRFMNYYEKVDGGQLIANFQAASNAPWTGAIRIQDFVLRNEQRLSNFIDETPQGSSRSLNDALNKNMDSGLVKFDIFYAEISKSDDSFIINKGILRGPNIGAISQGILYDAQGYMNMTGTFMPAYGLNRLFSNLPLVGPLLGNGQDRGLIGLTFKITGSLRRPQIMVNPISIIAPGIFRSIFEFK